MKKFTRIALVAFCCLAIVLARVFFESRRELIRAGEKIAANDTEEAIVHLDRAAHWYAPGNPYVQKALGELWQMGQKLEVTNPKLALLAYDSLRGSIYAVRSFYWPNREWLPKVNERIAQLRTREHLTLKPQAKFDEILAFHQKALETNERPSTGWVLIVQIGFLGWIGSVVGLIWKGFDREGRMFWKPSVPWIAAVIIFFALWVVGLVKA